jgi:hypothetical protein
MATTPERLPVFVKGGVTKFTELEDTPKSYTGQAGKALAVKATEDGLEFKTAPPPGLHASTHEEGGSDAINPSNIGANWNKLVNKPSTFPPSPHASSHQVGGSDQLSHSSLAGLDADDHTQYLNTTRHDTTNRHPLGTVVPHDSFLGLTDTPTSYTGQAGKSVRVNSAENTLEFWDNTIASITFIIDGGGSTITTGQKGHLEIPFDCEIESVTLLADQTGSIVIDIWKDTYANFPPTADDSICGGNKPTLSNAQKYQDSTLNGWTKTINAGDILAFNVDSASTITRLTIALKVKKT